MKNRIAGLTASGVRIVTGSPHTNGKTVDAATLLKFYEKNKYPMLAFKAGRNGNAFFASAEYNVARERQATLFKNMRAEYLLVRDRWARHGIPCIMIKSGGSFLPFPYTSDNLDILVNPHHEAAARAILLQLGYVELKNLEEPRKFLFRKFRGGELASDIHLHTRVGWGVGFMDDGSLWARAGVSPGDKAVIVPSPEDAILITLAHGLYENKKLKLADLVKMQGCWRDDVDWAYMKETASQSGWLDGLCFGVAISAYLERAVFGKTAVPGKVLGECRKELKKSSILYRYYRSLRRRSPLALPFSISFMFSKYLFYKKILGDRRDGLSSRLYQVIRTFLRGIRLKSGLRPQTPFLVSFSGIDGSGKTQHARVLEKCLRHYGLRVSYRWNRCATFGLTRLLSVVSQALFWRRTGPGNNAGTDVTVRRQRLSNPAFRLLWTYLTALDMIISNFFRVGLPLLCGQIVICDRYVYDAAAEMESSLPAVDKYNRFAIKMMLALAPRPDTAYFLDVPEKISTERRDENTNLKYLRRQRDVYAVMVNAYRLRIKRTDRDFTENADEIVREVAKPYFKVYPTLLNGLFLSNPGQLNPENREQS
ncbi:MAG: hypothetical protein A2Z29_02820 [Chloroflexi bacterium RBG_16_56_11]|nr:MAG: hypothetical protein A2Z29_02820 [Chloroflexi bacterium RBG_16_56_11]